MAIAWPGHGCWIHLLEPLGLRFVRWMTWGCEDDLVLLYT